MDVVGTSVASAGFGYIGSRYLIGNTGNVIISGKSMDKNLVVAGVVGIASAVGETTKDYFIPMLPESIAQSESADFAKASVGPALAGVSTYVLEKALVPPDGIGALQGTSNGGSAFANFALGAGSNIAGAYAYQSLFKKE